MPAFVSWVDSSSAERERMKRAVALFKERDTVDELGFGTIRDILSDALFPGTSTIQTRLRYFFFVPWLYQSLERRSGVTSATIDREMALVARGVIARFIDQHWDDVDEAGKPTRHRQGFYHCTPREGVPKPFLQYLRG